MDIKFKDWNCKLRKGHYGNGRIALVLIDKEDGEPVAFCTINVPNIRLESNQVAIKDYSENEGMLDTLVNAKVIEPPFIVVPFSFVSVPVCELIIDVNTLKDY